MCYKNPLPVLNSATHLAEDTELMCQIQALLCALTSPGKEWKYGRSHL